MDFILQGAAFFHKGGWVMYVLLLCSFFIVSIAIERFHYFKIADSGRVFAKQYCTYMAEEKITQAQDLAVNSKGDLANILMQAMKPKSNRSLAAFLEVQSGIALAKMKMRLYYLNVIVTLAPLLGLLGTINGMISAFSIFNIEAGQALAITGGVGEALIATGMGLCVAIVALVIHSYFAQRLERIITDMEQCFSILEAYEEQVKPNETA